MNSISREPERGRQTAFRHLLADAAETGPLKIGTNRLRMAVDEIAGDCQCDVD